MWHEYFPNSQIWGIDNDAEGRCPTGFDEDRIIFRLGNQDDSEFLAKLAQEAGNFDIIIDDCSHISDLTIKSFEILFPYLKAGGIYVIEDLHVCDYGPYLRFGPSTLAYLESLDLVEKNIKVVSIMTDTICFIEKEGDGLQ